MESVHTVRKLEFKNALSEGRSRRSPVPLMLPFSHYQMQHPATVFVPYLNVEYEEAQNKMQDAVTPLSVSGTCIRLQTSEIVNEWLMHVHWFCLDSQIRNLEGLEEEPEQKSFWCRSCERYFPEDQFRNCQQFGAHVSNCVRKRKCLSFRTSDSLNLHSAITKGAKIRASGCLNTALNRKTTRTLNRLLNEAEFAFLQSDERTAAFALTMLAP